MYNMYLDIISARFIYGQLWAWHMGSQATQRSLKLGVINKKIYIYLQQSNK